MRGIHGNAVGSTFPTERAAPSTGTRSVLSFFDKLRAGGTLREKKGRADYPPPSQNPHTQLQISNTADVCTALVTALYPSVLVGHKHTEFSRGVNAVIHPQGNTGIHPQGAQSQCPRTRAFLCCKHTAQKGTHRHKMPRNTCFQELCLSTNTFCNITFNYYPF